MSDHVLSCSCGSKLKVSSGEAGLVLECPRCNTPIKVPGFSQLQQLPLAELPAPRENFEIPPNRIVAVILFTVSIVVAIVALFSDLKVFGMSRLGLCVFILFFAAIIGGAVVWSFVTPNRLILTEHGIDIPTHGFVEWNRITSFTTVHFNLVPTLIVHVGGERIWIKWIYLGNGWQTLFEYHARYRVAGPSET